MRNKNNEKSFENYANLNCEDFNKLEQFDKEQQRYMERRKINVFLGLATAAILAGDIVLIHETLAVKTLEDMCPLSKIYYDLGMTQKAYEHQINHYIKQNLNGKFKYIPEQYMTQDEYALKGEKYDKTNGAIFQCEGVIVTDTFDNSTSMVVYDEEQKRLVKIDVNN